MTLQDRTVSVSSTWLHGTRTLLVTPRRQGKCRTHVLQCSMPVSTDDVVELREIAQQIIGIADVRRSDLRDKLLIDFVDPRISNEDIVALTQELLRLAIQHTAPTPHRTQPPITSLSLAMAVHSEVRRLDSYDR